MDKEFLVGCVTIVLVISVALGSVLYTNHQDNLAIENLVKSGTPALMARCAIKGFNTLCFSSNLHSSTESSK